MTVTDSTPTDAAQGEAFAGRLFDASYEFLDLLTVYVGDRLNLYRVLADEGPLSAGELARRAGIHPRYAQGWMEQQGVTGIIDVEDLGQPDGGTPSRSGTRRH